MEQTKPEKHYLSYHLVFLQGDPGPAGFMGGQGPPVSALKIKQCVSIVLQDINVSA